MRRRRLTLPLGPPAQSLAPSLAIPRSLALAVALRVALATALVCVIAFSLVYVGLADHSRKALLGIIDTDLAGLADVYAAQGESGLEQRLSERLDLAPTRGERPVYLLLDSNGKNAGGNLAHWPKLDAGLSDTTVIALPGERILVRGTLLRGGVKLLVGRSMKLSDAALSQVRLLFAGALALIVIAAFFIGNLAAGALRQRIRHINDVFDSLQEGGAAARVVLSPHPDELDALAGHVNLTLDRVERLIRAQRDVSDNIAHEVRTPLMTLNQKLETALSRCEDRQSIAALEDAQGQVRGLTRLLDALLDIASAQAQRGDMRHLAEINLSELAANLTELYEPSADEIGVRLVADIAPDVVMLGDAMQMSRLMVNLLDNALKYGAPGEVRFSIKPGPVITIEDDGPGVPDTEKARIFERYARVSQTAAKGHGLGLALVCAIAERHNLVIGLADTHPGEIQKGAKFVIAPEGPL